ncbi:isoaspartyl peptidase/L-asparaginase, partial [Vibrio sp. 1565-1]|nr:isoaspartyl peptidase/L-asparaginase [Vibrio sp. 1565-1]
MTKPFSIAIHGGAGTILREQMSDELQQSILADLDAA